MEGREESRGAGGGPDWLRATLRLGSTAATALANLAYPPQCLACGSATGTPVGLCGPCWRALPFISRPFCERLGTPFAQDFGPGALSPAAIAQPPSFGRARGVVLFRDGPARRLVHRLKYGDRHEVARLLGPLMAGAARELAADTPLLVPMPLHRTRLWWRQFNQAALLARAMAGPLGLTVDPHALARVRATPSQVGLTRIQRLDNVQGAFRVTNPQAVASRPVLLVDDVLTTGATADTAARTLLRAGAARVDVVVFALVATAPLTPI